MYSWEIQPAEREGEKLCETVTTPSSTLPTRKYKKGGNFQKIEMLRKAVS
jgi:hypothetical protein